MRALGQAHKVQNASAPNPQMVINVVTPPQLHQFGILLVEKWPSQKGTSRLATTLYCRMCQFKVDFAKQPDMKTNFVTIGGACIFIPKMTGGLKASRHIYIYIYIYIYSYVPGHRPLPPVV